MAFNKAAVTELFSAAVSVAQELSIFDRVNQHEPKSAPGSGLSCAFAGAGIRPVRSSGLAATSGVIDLHARIYASRLAKPEDGVDPAVIAAASALIGAFSDGFTLGGIAREVDLIGQFGTALSAQMGFLDQDGKPFRVADVTIPVVVNDLWTQEP